MTATPVVGSSFFGLDISQFTTWLLSMRRRISKRVLLLEFGPDYLLLAEATLTQLGVQLSHVSSFSLPPEALIVASSEPLKMATLIQDFCSEENPHRVAVCHGVGISASSICRQPLTEEAREYIESSEWFTDSFPC